MKKTKTHRHPIHRLVIVAGISAVVLVAVSVAADFAGSRTAFVSHEVDFTDASEGGLEILPASCASSPSYFHYALATTTDNKGFISYPGNFEHGAYRNSVYICITNNTGSTFFVPANTAAEMNAVKALGTSIPGLLIY